MEEIQIENFTKLWDKSKRGRGCKSTYKGYHVSVCLSIFVLWACWVWATSLDLVTCHGSGSDYTHFCPVATLGLHLGFSAKLRTWQVSACKMEPRSGTIITDRTSQPPSRHLTLFFQCCVVFNISGCDSRQQLFSKSVISDFEYFRVKCP